MLGHFRRTLSTVWVIVKATRVPNDGVRERVLGFVMRNRSSINDHDHKN